MARWLGVASSGASAVLWVIFVGANPYAPQGLGPASVGIGCLMVLLGLAGVRASLRQRWGWMYVIFALSFIPEGLYMLGTPGIFRGIGIANLVFLGAAVATQASAKTRAEQSRIGSAPETP